MAYRIVDWDSHFEINRSRDLKILHWVPVPNKMDGDGYTELIDHPDGASIYGAWIACVLVASKCDPRGTLLRDGNKEHNSASLSRITRIKEKWFDLMFERAVSIGWIEPYDNPALGCDNPALGCLEGKGMEQKGMEGTRDGTEPDPVVPLESIVSDLELRSIADEWLEYKCERREGYKPRGLKTFFTQIAKAEKAHGAAAVVEALQAAAADGWKGWQGKLGQIGSNNKQKTFDEIRLERTAEVVRKFGNE